MKNKKSEIVVSQTIKLIIALIALVVLVGIVIYTRTGLETQSGNIASILS